MLINSLWVSVPFLSSFGGRCCEGAPPYLGALRYADDGEQSLTDYLYLKAEQGVRERTCERENEEVTVRNLHIWGVRLWGFFVCLFSPWDFNVLFYRSSAVITILSPSIPAAQLVGGIFPAMINYSLSESKSAFSSLIIFDEFIQLTWAWIEAIDDNKLTLSILMTSLGDYGWIKE